MALKTLDRGMENLGLLVSLQTAAIVLEINRNDFQQALARHETLKPWLGETPLWKNRHKQLSENILTEAVK
jgi:hypothetical protein